MDCEWGSVDWGVVFVGEEWDCSDVSRCAWLMNCARTLCLILFMTESSGIALIDFSFRSVRTLSRSCIETIAGRKKPSSRMNASSSSSITTMFFPTSEKPPTVCIFTIFI